MQIISIYEFFAKSIRIFLQFPSISYVSLLYTGKSFALQRSNIRRAKKGPGKKLARTFLVLFIPF